MRALLLLVSLYFPPIKIIMNYTHHLYLYSHHFHQVSSLLCPGRGGRHGFTDSVEERVEGIVRDTL